MFFYTVILEHCPEDLLCFWILATSARMTWPGWILGTEPRMTGSRPRMTPRGKSNNSSTYHYKKVYHKGWFKCTISCKKMYLSNILILRYKKFLKKSKNVLDLNHRLNHTPKTPKNNVNSMRCKVIFILPIPMIRLK